MTEKDYNNIAKIIKDSFSGSFRGDIGEIVYKIRDEQIEMMGQLFKNEFREKIVQR